MPHPASHTLDIGRAPSRGGCPLPSPPPLSFCLFLSGTLSSPVVMFRIATDHPAALHRRRPAGKRDRPAALDLRSLCCCGCYQRVRDDISVALDVYIWSEIPGLEKGERDKRTWAAAHGATHKVVVDLPRDPWVARPGGAVAHCLLRRLFTLICDNWVSCDLASLCFDCFRVRVSGDILDKVGPDAPAGEPPVFTRQNS